MVMNSIYLRLFTPFVLTLLLATVAGWWVGTSLLSRSLEQRLGTQLDHTVAVLSERNFPFTQEVLQRVGRLVRADIVLIDNNQQPGLSTLSTDNESLTQAIARHHATWQTDKEGARWFNFQLNQTPYMLVFRKIEADRDPRYTAVAAVADLSDVQQASRRAAWWLGAAALVGIPILAWLGHRIAHTITDPIRELAGMAGDIAEGDRSVRARVHHQDEVGELAKALNTMAAKLTDFEKGIAENSRLAAAGQMAARVAHEIRNPLTAIKMQIQLLGETLDSEHQPTSDAILDEIRRLELIISNTLQSSQPPRLVRQNLNLNSLVDEVIQLQQAHFAHRGVHLETALEEALPEISLDSDRIKQVLLNLLINAGDELPDGGQIRISTSHDANRGEITLVVEDSGPGIPEDQHLMLFASGDSNKPGGLGLGLRVCKELIEQHSGSIAVQASDLGGARFLIKFPLEV